MRSSDPTNTCFGAFKPKSAKIRTFDVYHDWRTHKLPLRITVGSRERKGDNEGFQLCYG